VATMKYLLMEDALDAPRPSQAGYWHRTLLPVTGPTAKDTSLLTGQNRIWVATNQLYVALLTGDQRRAEVVRDAFAAECQVQSGEGIKEDYSFHQHGPLLYTGGYGQGFSEDVARYVWMARGTRYQIPTAGFEALSHYVLEGAVWSIYENYYDPSVRGREITRGDDEPQQAPLSLLVLANVPNPRQAEAIAAAKSFHQFVPSYGMQEAPLWLAVRSSPVPAALPLGHRHYWESDYTVHRAPDYFASLRMFSDRTKAAELIDGEGLNCWHLSDGLLWVFLHGSDYATHNVLPTMDWLRLPGTTVERRELKPAEGYEKRPRPAPRAFVGGAFTPERGVSAMALAAAVAPLTAKKSWFFFGDEIVCLGSDIDCPTDFPTETIVNQRPLADPAAPLTVDGKVQAATLPWHEVLTDPKWAHCEGIGYYFPEPARLQAQRAVQTGAWRSMTETGSQEVHANPFLTLWFDHGTQAKGAGYAYAVLPAKTAAQTEAYAASPPITILAHDNKAHAVQQNARHAVGIVFWEPGTVGRLTTDRACLAYYEETAEGLTLAVSDPTHESSVFHITIEEALTIDQLPAEVGLAVGSGQTMLTYHAEKGRNYVVTFKRGQ
jgi:chondroitin AC lyase